MLLRTLGGLELSGSTFTRPKPLLLLCYLALEGARERRHLAELFFPASRDPRNRVAVTLARLRGADAGLVGTDASRVWTDLEADAGRLLAASQRSDHAAVVDLYRGPFLEGIATTGWSVELESWVYGTRDFLAAQVETAHLALAEAEAAEGEFRSAAERAATAWEVARTAGLEPEDIRRAHVLLLAGEHPQAPRLRDEAREFDLDLPTTADEARAALGFVARPPTNLDRETSRFVGRQRELERLTGLLADPEIRLVTVVGGGGTGKTRLATRAARRELDRGSFADGVYVAFLDAVSSSAAVPAKLADVLELDPRSAEAPLDQVANRIGTRRTLLVLDNLEHLLDAAPLLAELLRRCPRLTLLATSRERLALTEEWLFPLAGLAFPPAGDAVPAGESEAVALFLARARQIVPGFAPEPDARRSIGRICRRVEGSPLALELAATLLRVLPPGDIADELERDPDVLASSARDRAERHRSVRAVFERSWSLLASDERIVLRKLAVFRGGFARRAAAAVAGATIPLLAALVDKSLLRVDARGRYDRHPLVYHYTREKLALEPAEARAAAAAHAAWFARFSAGLRVEFNGPRPQRAWERLEAEFENCRAAWSWALAERRADLLLGLVNAVWFRFGNWHPDSEAIGFWEEAAAALDADDPEHREALGMMLALQAQLRSVLGDADARALAERGLALLRPFGNRLGLGICLATLGRCAEAEGRIAEALAWTEEVTKNTVPDLRAESLVSAADLEMKLGMYRSAERRLREALAASRGARETRTTVYALRSLGRVNLLVGDLGAAQRYYRESLDLARAEGFMPGSARGQEIDGLLGLAETALARGAFGEARARVREVEELRTSPGEAASAAIVLGRIETARGDHRRAEGCFRRALEGLEFGNGPFLTDEFRDADLPHLLLYWSELLVARGRCRSAATVLGFLRGELHAAYDRDLAGELLDRLGSELSAGEVEAALLTGERMDPDDVVALVANAGDPVGGGER